MWRYKLEYIYLHGQGVTVEKFLENMLLWFSLNPDPQLFDHIFHSFPRKKILLLNINQAYLIELVAAVLKDLMHLRKRHVTACGNFAFLRAVALEKDLLKAGVTVYSTPLMIMTSFESLLKQCLPYRFTSLVILISVTPYTCWSTSLVH